MNVRLFIRMIIVLGTVALETIVGLGYKLDQVLTGDQWTSPRSMFVLLQIQFQVESNQFWTRTLGLNILLGSS